MFAALNAFLTRAVSAGYFLNKSLRFRSSASAYLNRTLTTPTSSTIYTWSGWVKRGALSATGYLFGASTTTNFGFNSSDQLLLTLSGTAAVTTTAVYRDPAAWYHLVYVQNGSAQTIYVNGVSAGTGTTANTVFNTAIAHQLAAANTTSYFDGELTEVNFVDGQALAPTAFGAYSTYNQWLPIKYAGTYGTNGFYLPFSPGTDTSSVSVNYLVVAGGGSGGQAGGGGGGYLTGTLSISPSTPYTVTVGAGGVFAGGANRGTNGGNSVFSSITATGGGAGGGNDFETGANGGSGGGGAYVPGGAGTGVSGQGFAGGIGNNGGATSYNSGGGGGASGVGGSTTTATVGGNGADGLASSISGTSTYYAGGGGGGAFAVPGTNGLGGGATANRGGGSGTNTNGGSGVVIISYAGAQKFYGGTVTSSGGNTIHTFTASGFLTSVFNDASGNGNNWTPNNISLTAGSTYDSLTDVPTLTSETVANYAVLNPLGNVVGAQATLSNGNLTASGNNWGNSTISLLAPGKFYFEYTIATVTAPNTPYCGLGSNFADVTAYVNDGRIFLSGSVVTTVATYTSGDVIACAYDTAGTVTFYKNNTSVYSGSYAYRANLFFLTYANNSTASVNFGQQPFTYTPPTGFLPLNTFNI